MVGIPAEAHEELKALAKRDGLAMYEVVLKALDLYKRLTAGTAEVKQ